MMNVGGGDGGARLTVAEGVALHETCETAKGWSKSYLPICGRSKMERDCIVNAYRRTYCDATRTENAST